MSYVCSINLAPAGLAWPFGHGLNFLNSRETAHAMRHCQFTHSDQRERLGAYRFPTPNKLPTPPASRAPPSSGEEFGDDPGAVGPGLDLQAHQLRECQPEVRVQGAGLEANHASVLHFSLGSAGNDHG